MADLGAEQFVQLTTFRRSGEPVSTPVWIAREADTLIVTTPADSGKVKRLRQDPRVELRPSTRRGHVDPATPASVGTARIEEDPATVRRATGLIGRKYGLEYRITMLIEKLVARHRRRVILRISPA